MNESAEDPESPDETRTDASDLWDRETAPQSPYSMRQVGIGILVAIAVAIVAYGLPFALA